MVRVVASYVLFAIAALYIASPTFGQDSKRELFVLDSRTASRSLDAVPAVFAVAQVLEDADIDLSIDGLAGGYSDLASRSAAQEQLTAALSVYGFESYGGWATTIETVFSTYAYIRSKGLTDSEVDSALRQVISDSGIPQAQKAAITSGMKSMDAGDSEADAEVPLFDNLKVVIALLPQIESTVTMMEAMQ